MCLVGANLNQFKMPLFKTVERNGRCRRIRNEVASGPLCHPAPALPPAPFLAPTGSLLKSVSESFQRSCLLKDCSFRLDILCLSYLARECFCWAKPSSFSLCLMPYFRRKPEKPFPRSRCDWALCSLSEWMFPPGNDPCPLLGHQKKGRTVTHYQSVGDLSAPVRLNWRQG